LGLGILFVGLRKGFVIRTEKILGSIHIEVVEVVSELIGGRCDLVGNKRREEGEGSCDGVIGEVYRDELWTPGDGVGY
jgi:hypothetical protein